MPRKKHFYCTPLLRKDVFLFAWFLAFLLLCHSASGTATDENTRSDFLKYKEPESETSNIFISSLRMIVSLLVVLAIIFFSLFLLKKLTARGRRVTAKNPIIVLSQAYIGPKKSICLVKIADEVLALGVTSSQISFLTKIEPQSLFKEEGWNVAITSGKNMEGTNSLESFPTLGSLISKQNPPEDNFVRKLANAFVQNLPFIQPKVNKVKGFLSIFFLFSIFLQLILMASPSFAAPVPIPKITVGVADEENPKDVSTALQVFLLITVLSLAPAILLMMTSFTRIVVVLSFLRHGLSTQQMPPNQILIGLALFLTFFVMAPVWQEVNATAFQPYLAGQIPQKVAFENATKPIRNFMLKETREKDLALMVHLSKLNRPKNISEVPTTVIIPAFVISELKTAFQIGFLIFIPFLIVDLVVASVLMSMGMLMLPPVMISLPFKILLFVLVDGWHLIVRSLIVGFG